MNYERVPLNFSLKCLSVRRGDAVRGLQKTSLNSAAESWRVKTEVEKTKQNKTNLLW